MDNSQEKQRSDLVDHYSRAKKWVLGSSYAQEVYWQQTRDARDTTETSFLREYAWVILNSGFRESVIRARFDYISLCFYDWDSAGEIADNGAICVATASRAFNNLRKLRAIVQTAELLATGNFDRFAEQLLINPIAKLRELPFLGPITAVHLAKNLGFSCAKPDRHLVRLAVRFGFGTVETMCRLIEGELGDDASVADLILWRYEEQQASCRQAFV